GADAGGGCHGDGAKLLFLVRHPLYKTLYPFVNCVSTSKSYYLFSNCFNTSKRSSPSSVVHPQSPAFRSAPQFGQSPLQSGLQSACIGSSISAYSRIASPRSTR